MRSNAAALSDEDKRLIAEWVGGRKLDSDLAGAAEKMTNVCTSHPQVRESNAPAWNGWGVDYPNSRFQSGAAAGLSPGQVSRLQLKWRLPGNVLLAFAPAVRLDVYADELKRNEVGATSVR